MGFDRHWLALREPVDLRSRDQNLLSIARQAIEQSSKDVVLDIGCGTGSTYRSIAPHLMRQIRWRLLDNDEKLLDEVDARHGNTVETVRMDLNRIDQLPLQEVSLITASALFDLCSSDFIETFSRLISKAHIGLYAALNYDGEMAWTDGHPLDLAVTDAFNAHQQSDKGLGMSLGPDAWQFLADCLIKEGHDVHVAESPWLLKGDDMDLQLLLLSGIAGAVEEYGLLEGRDLASWLEYRRQSAMDKRGRCRIGHRDIIALV